MKKQYGDLICKKRGNTFIVKAPKSSLEAEITSMDTFTLMMSMWVLEEYLVTEDDPLLAVDIVLKRVKDHIKEVMGDRAVG